MRFEFFSLVMVSSPDFFLLMIFLVIEGVGKTSIIHTIVTDTFPKDVKKQFQTVTISPDLYLLPNNHPTILVDSSASKTAE